MTASCAPEVTHQDCTRAADLASSTAWQPRGILVAHLAEHRRAINRIAVAQSAAFFVTASDDETCKIWDSRRLEKDISFRSKLTYASQVLHCACSGSAQLKVAANVGATACVHCEEHLMDCLLPLQAHLRLPGAALRLFRLCTGPCLPCTCKI